jgi:hypothetical protein
VKEGGGDNSELKLTKTIPIPMNKDIVRLEEPTSQTITGSIDTLTNDYKEVYVGDIGGNEDILLWLNVKVDGGGPDLENIGLMTGVKVYFTEKVKVSD